MYRNVKFSWYSYICECSVSLSECLQYFVFILMFSNVMSMLHCGWVFFFFWYSVSSVNLLEYYLSLIARKYSFIVYYIAIFSYFILNYALKVYVIICLLYIMFSTFQLWVILTFALNFDSFLILFHFSQVYPSRLNLF